MRSPVRWFGGKGILATKLVKLFPPHTVYVEPFGGGASVLFAKAPSKVEVYNDIDEGLVNFFHVLRDPKMFTEFQRQVSLTPYSRSGYDVFRRSWMEKTDSVERAAAWFIVARQSFSGTFADGWSSTIRENWRGVSASVATYLSAVDRLPEAHLRLMCVQVEQQDFRTILKRYDTPDTLFYLDPPYLHATRQHKRYAHEMTKADHTDLVEKLLQLQGMAVLSGYDDGSYLLLENAGWSKQAWQTSSFATARTTATGILGPTSAKKEAPRTETVWCKITPTEKGV